MQAPRFHGMVGSSRAMSNVYSRIRNISPFDIPILIMGESGSGKELVARAIHNESTRRSGPFHAVNTGALTPELIASELFGHEKGAFTGATAAKQGFFEIANGGTLFLDEIGTMSADTQVNLLRIIESQTFTRVGGTTPIHSDVRILAATNIDLRSRVRANEFRRDLYYRLSVFPLALPPLRTRRDDIPVLAEYFRERFTAEFDRPIRGFDRGAVKQLRAYGWPGNVRELSNMIIRLVVGASGEVITEAEVVAALYQTAMQVVDEVPGEGRVQADVQTSSAPASEYEEQAPVRSAAATVAAPAAAAAGAAPAATVPSAAGGPSQEAGTSTDDQVVRQAATHEDAEMRDGVGMRDGVDMRDGAESTMQRPTPEPGNARGSGQPVDGSDEPTIHAGLTIEDVERKLIEATLREAHGNRTKAAKLLGISRKSLYNKIKAYDLAL